MTINRSERVAISSITAALVGIWLAKHGVQRRYEWHSQPPQQLQNVRARPSSKDSVFMLQADQIDIAEIQKVRGLPVGSQIIFGQLESHSRGIVVALFGIVNRKRQQAPSRRIPREWRRINPL